MGGKWNAFIFNDIFAHISKNTALKKYLYINKGLRPVSLHASMLCLAARMNDSLCVSAAVSRNMRAHITSQLRAAENKTWFSGWRAIPQDRWSHLTSSDHACFHGLASKTLQVCVGAFPAFYDMWSNSSDFISEIWHKAGQRSKLEDCVFCFMCQT